jgi:dodecin
MAKRTTESRNRVYKRIDLVGVSTEGLEAAVQAAIQRASDTLTDLRWFEVKEVRGAIANGRVTEYQVVVTVSFEVRE